MIISRRGRKLAAVIPIEDLRLLERLMEEQEDRADAEEARRRMADPAERPVPYERARRELGLA